jgi:hypothetical protein
MTKELDKYDISAIQDAERKRETRKSKRKLRSQPLETSSLIDELKEHQFDNQRETR